MGCFVLPFCRFVVLALLGILLPEYILGPRFAPSDMVVSLWRASARVIVRDFIL
jgi:hypothetical protein